MGGIMPNRTKSQVEMGGEGFWGYVQGKQGGCPQQEDEDVGPGYRNTRNQEEGPWPDPVIRQLIGR